MRSMNQFHRAGNRMSHRVCPLTGRMFLLLGFTLAGFLLGPSTASALDEPSPTTESSCTFGMVKGDRTRSCRIPIPPGCVIARFPDTTKPWANISKGGATTCRFNDKETDWKTRITGTCNRCTSFQCTARFGVMFACSQDK